MEIKIINCLQDNFSYLLIDEKSLNACVVDPGEAQPILKYIENNKINLKFILNTHHHHDHIGGNNILKSEFGAKILAFKGDKKRIPKIDIFFGG
jgi:Zn-dependent hydrolases, including glyoxylases